MFNKLGDNLGKIFAKLKGKGLLNEDDINSAMREIRIALLEADVALPVAKEFINKLKERALGQEVIKSVSPGQMIVKLVNDYLIEILGNTSSEINLNMAPPAVIMMAGLQGSGKTTSCAKIALQLKNKLKKKILMASLDIYRPAAQKQLEILGKQAQIDTLPIIEGEKPLAITARALEKARIEAYDILMLDTAGRLHIDDELMTELQEVKKLAQPIETLLVADILTGQDAVNIAGQFNEKISVTGVVLTRVDGDARGGAALSMRMITGCPIKYIGIGEKISDIEPFHPERIASRILDMGDVVSLVERAAEAIDKEEAEKVARKLKKGKFDLEDLNAQLNTIKKMGGMGGLIGMMPGIGKIKKQMEEKGMDEKILTRQQAIISSMTLKERRSPDIINASRRKRIAAGSGTSVQDVNTLLKQFRQMQDMIKKFGSMDKKSLMRSGLKNMFK